MVWPIEFAMVAFAADIAEWVFAVLAAAVAVVVLISAAAVAFFVAPLLPVDSFVPFVVWPATPFVFFPTVILSPI